ncbi:MAG: DUF4157 domain-containing protein [Cyclobacteriaceae bacterium]|nr:DUF4157 domain-containing protein [Cyclobacteriaceae bacterium]
MFLHRNTDHSFFGSQKESGTVAPASVFFKPAVQTKLQVNQPGDDYEKEADLIAERVVNTPVSTVGSIGNNAQDIQRQEQEPEEEEETLQTAEISIQRLMDEEKEETPVIQSKEITFIQRDNNNMGASSEAEEENLQTYSNQGSTSMYHSDVIQMSGRGPPGQDTHFQNQLHSAIPGGQSIPEPVGIQMSSRFGADFSQVKIHTDTGAQHLSKQLNAHAFTYGNHIFFNSGKFEPDSGSGRRLLAHELTHTIQQGAIPLQSKAQRNHSFTAVQKKSILQRQAAPQLTKAVELAEAEQGKVIANKEGADGYRFGWDRLMEYFTTTFGDDKIVSRPTGEQGVVYKEHIKKKSVIPGMVPNQPDTHVRENRDAMPSWCGIFAFWALNKAGIPMPKWKLGESFIPPEAAYPPGHTPKPGDLAFRQKRSHYGLVIGMEGSSRVKSVNGNTAGDDNLGGEVQVQTHDISNWQGFFNPLVAMTGNLRDPELGDADTEPKTFRELRKLKYNVSRKAENDEEEPVQAKTEDHREEEEKEMMQAKPEQLEEEEETVQRMEMGNAGGFASNGEEFETDDQPADIQTKAISSAALQVKNKSPGPMIQGGWLGDAWNAVSGLASDIAGYIEEGLDAAKDWLMDKVRDFVIEIPGYTLLSYILGYDPITGRSVDKTPLTLLNVVLDLIPIGGDMVKWVLDYFEATNPVANWLFDSVKRFSDLISGVESRFEKFWNSLSLDDVGDPEGVMNRVADLFRDTITSIVSFVGEVGGDFLTMVKDIAINVLVKFIKEYFPDAYDLLTVILGEDPVTKQPVDRNGTNILNAALKVLGERGAQIKGQMIENGIFDKCVAWIDRSINLVLSLISDIGNIFDTIWKAISFESLYTPIETFTEIAQAFITPITRIVDFMTDAMIQLVAILREALLSGLSNFAKETRGYFLITVLIGKDPFTGDRVPRNTENIIHGFFSLMDGGEEQFRQLKESGKIDQMSEEIDKAVRQLNFTLEYILGLFTSLWESMDWNDFLNPPGVFRRIVNTFGDPVIRLVRFIVTIVKIAIEILLIAMNFPFETVNNIIQRSMEAFANIKRDPIGFLINILKGIKQGFVQFFANILKHLLKGLADWLFGSLGDLGIKMPPDLSFKSILDLVLQILGISIERIMERVWLKLTEQIGAEKVAKIKGAIDKLTGIWTFVKDVIDRGPIAIWEFIKEKLSDLWKMVLDAAKNWIMTKIITEVTVKLLSMLDPTGIMAVINSVIAIYRAIQSFIEQLKAMLEIFNSFVNGVAEIAAGNIKVAADYLEGAMARGIPVLIGFLANQVGLGGIGKKLAEIIGKIREKITEAIDWLVGKALKVGRPIIDGVLRVIEFGEGVVEKGKSAIKGAINKILEKLGLRKTFRTKDGQNHSLYIQVVGNTTNIMVASTPKTIEQLMFDRRAEITKQNSETPSKVAINQPILNALNLIESTKAQIVPLLSQYQIAVDRSSSRESEEIKTQLNNKVNIIIEQLIIADINAEGTNNIETHVSHNTISENRPSQVLAFPLTSIPGNTAGSTPQEAPLGWDLIDPSKRSKSWVAAHLLNHNLHGPGLNWNLVSGTKETNNNMKTEIENRAKQDVIGNPNKQYYYQVDVNYFGENPTKPNLKLFPFQIKVEYGELTGGPGAYTRNLISSSTFTQDSPEITNISLTSFNESSASRLKEASDGAGKNIPRTVFAAIVEVRRTLPTQSYGNSIENLIATMDSYYANNKGKTPGWFNNAYRNDLIDLSNKHIFMEF